MFISAAGHDGRVQADDQWRGLGRIVRFRNVEQVSARLAGGDDGPIGLIADANPGHNRQDESYRKTDDDHQYTEDDLFPFTFHIWTGISDFSFAVVYWVLSFIKARPQWREFDAAAVRPPVAIAA